MTSALPRNGENFNQTVDIWRWKDFVIKYSVTVHGQVRVHLSKEVIYVSYYCSVSLDWRTSGLVCSTGVLCYVVCSKWKKKKKLMELAVTQWESVFGGWRRLVPTWLRYTVLLCQSVFSLQKHTGRTELQYQLTNTHTLSHTGRFPHPELNPPRPLWPFRKVFDPWAPVLDKSVHVCVSYGETKRPRETKSKFPDFQLILSD